MRSGQRVIVVPLGGPQAGATLPARVLSDCPENREVTLQFINGSMHFRRNEELWQAVVPGGPALSLTPSYIITEVVE